MSSEAWFDEYYDAVYSYILMLVKNRHTAEDLYARNIYESY